MVLGTRGLTCVGDERPRMLDRRPEYSVIARGACVSANRVPAARNGRHGRGVRLVVTHIIFLFAAHSHKVNTASATG
jgi:hypothetical protein